MAGLIQDAMPQGQPPQPPGAMPQGPLPPRQSGAAAGDTQRGSSNPILKQMMQQMLDGIPPNRRSAVERLVLAGLQVMFAAQMQKRIQQQMQAGSPEQAIPQGIAALISLIQSKSKGPLPAPALIPASVILLCEALDFLASAGQIQVTKELVGRCTENLLAYMAQKLGVTANTLVNAKLEGAKMAAQSQRAQGGAAGAAAPPQPPQAPQPGQSPAAGGL